VIMRHKLLSLDPPRREGNGERGRFSVPPIQTVRQDPHTHRSKARHDATVDPRRRSSLTRPTPNPNTPPTAHPNPAPTPQAAPPPEKCTARTPRHSRVGTAAKNHLPTLPASHGYAPLKRLAPNPRTPVYAIDKGQRRAQSRCRPRWPPPIVARAANPLPECMA